MYESFYNLKDSPFQLTPNSHFYYNSSTHRRALVNLRHSLQHQESFVVVTGRSGIGKTELMQFFISELESRFDNVARISMSQLRVHNILEFIAGAFGVVSMSMVGDALAKKIERDLTERAEKNQRFFVIVDNAHLLSQYAIEKLTHLCAIKVNSQPLIQCVLFAENSIHTNLKRLSLELNNFQLEPISRSEIQPYIEYRLLQAGWQGNPNFRLDACETIHEISRGVPWHINLLCHRLLMQACLDGDHEINVDRVHAFKVVDIRALEESYRKQQDRTDSVEPVIDWSQQHHQSRKDRHSDSSSDKENFRNERIFAVNGGGYSNGLHDVNRFSPDRALQHSTVKVEGSCQPVPGQRSNLYNINTLRKSREEISIPASEIADNIEQQHDFKLGIDGPVSEQAQQQTQQPFTFKTASWEYRGQTIPTLSEQAVEQQDSSAIHFLQDSRSHQSIDRNRVMDELNEEFSFEIDSMENEHAAECYREFSSSLVDELETDSAADITSMGKNAVFIDLEDGTFTHRAPLYPGNRISKKTINDGNAEFNTWMDNSQAPGNFDPYYESDFDSVHNAGRKTPNAEGNGYDSDDVSGDYASSDYVSSDYVYRTRRAQEHRFDNIAFTEHRYPNNSEDHLNDEHENSYAQRKIIYPAAWDSGSGYLNGKTPAQIAARASIITSLAITLVLWMTNDSKMANLVEKNPGESSKVFYYSMGEKSAAENFSPSPYEDPNVSALQRRNMQDPRRTWTSGN